MLWPGSAAINPLFEIGYLFLTERLPFRRHSLGSIKARYTANEFTLRGLARNNRFLPRLKSGNSSFARRQSQPGFGLGLSVTLQALSGEQWLDVPVEISGQESRR